MERSIDKYRRDEGLIALEQANQHLERALHNMEVVLGLLRNRRKLGRNPKALKAIRAFEIMDRVALVRGRAERNWRIGNELWLEGLRALNQPVVAGNDASRGTC